MPPLRLTSLLQGALAPLSPTSRAVVSTLTCRNGHALRAGEVAAWVGLRNRQQLARALQRDGLPPLEQLAGWTRVLHWMLEAESTGASLLQVAYRDKVDPAVAYRLVRRVTGLRWSQARRAGLLGLLSRFSVQRPDRPLGAGARIAERSPPSGPVAWCAPVAERPSAAGSITLPLNPAVPSRPRGVLAGRVPLSGSPYDVAVTRSGDICVTRLHAAVIACLESRSLRVVAEVRTGPVPTRLAFDPSKARGYVTLQFADEVGEFDLLTRRETGRIPVPGNPLAAGLTAGGRTLLVNTNLDLLCRIDTALGRVTGSLAIPQAGLDLAFHPCAPLVYVNTWKAGLILEVDTRTLQTVRTFEVGGAPQELVVSGDGVMLYAANEHGWLDAIQLRSGRRVARVDLGSPAISLASTPDGALLYVGLVFAGSVVALDRQALTIVATLRTSGKPRRVAFDPSGRAAFIANEVGWVDRVV